MQEISHLVQYLLYVICATFACISNLVFISIFLSARFRQKYVMLTAFSFGYLIDGMAFLLAGALRLKYIFGNTYYISSTPLECVSRTPYPILLILGGRFPATINACITLERILALEFPTWYHVVWKNSCRYCLITFSILLCLTSCTTALFIALNGTWAIKTWKCSIFETYGILYGTCHYAIVSSTYLICFLVLVMVFRKLNNAKVPSAETIRRQRLLLTITGVSTLLISFPFFVNTLKEWKPNYLHPMAVGLIKCILPLHSGIPLLAYCAFLPQIRSKIASYFCAERLK